MNQLPPNSCLPRGSSLTSTNGRYTLTVQSSDGNPVLYRDDGTPLWSSNTPGAAGLWMQGDGNLVAYDAEWKTLWHAQTHGHPGAALFLQDDGNFVVYLNGVPLWASGTSEAQPDYGRHGRVRLAGRGFADDDGAFLALGLPRFDGVRMAAEEPGRLRQNARWAREQGADFLRVFCDTTDWLRIVCADGQIRDRSTDPRRRGFAADVRECRNIIASEGLRVFWTLAGGNQTTPQEQEQCLADTLGAVADRPDRVQGIEISNEGNGFRDHNGLRRMQAFAAVIAAHGYPVTLTSAAHIDPTVYLGSNASFINIHFQRTDGDNGWRWVRQPYPGPSEFGLDAFAPYGTLEPGGPGASIYSDTDPLRIAHAAVSTWLCGGAIHIVHCGAGIFGVPTIHPTAGYRPGNLWEQPALPEALETIRAMRALLPLDLPNWARTRHGQPEHPFRFPPDERQTVGDGALPSGPGCVRAYAMHKDGQYVCVPIGIMDRLSVEPTHAADWRLFRGDTGAFIAEGGPHTFEVRERDHGRAVVITGQYR